LNWGVPEENFFSIHAEVGPIGGKTTRLVIQPKTLAEISPTSLQGRTVHNGNMQATGHLNIGPPL